MRVTNRQAGPEPSKDSLKIAGVLLVLAMLFTACASSPSVSPDTATREPTSTLSSTTTRAPAPTTEAPSFYVSVEYRATPVDLLGSQFEYQPTTGSSFVDGAWYDRANAYMIIKLDSRYYHYCDLPEEVWASFGRADSFGSFYNAQIKGRYDCRSGYVPPYG